MNARVTVLIAIYKAGAFLAAKLDNLHRQTIFDSCNIMLLNCQDLEKESEIYADFLTLPNVHEIKYSEHIFLYESWNDGIKAMSDEYITNANVDDMWHPEYLARCAQYLDDNPDYACVSSVVLTTTVKNQADPTFWRFTGMMPALQYPASTAGPCPVWRRSLHDKYGYFDKYRVIGDAKLWEKWLAGGEKFGLIYDNLVLYYADSNSLERRIDTVTGRSMRDLDMEQLTCDHKISEPKTNEPNAQDQSPDEKLNA
jgi:GT2 family glycosyltransferase